MTGRAEDAEEITDAEDVRRQDDAEGGEDEKADNFANCNLLCK